MIMREKITARLSLGAAAGVLLLTLIVLPGFTPAQVTTATPVAPPPPTESQPTARSATPPALPVAQTAPIDEQLPPPEPALPGLTPSAPPEPPLDLRSVQPSFATTAEPPLNETSLSQEFGAEEIVRLTRATYRLPAPLATSFADFLNSNLADAVQARTDLTSVEAPGPESARIIVTADEETQRVVGQFIGLLRARGKATGPTVQQTYSSYSDRYSPESVQPASPNGDIFDPVEPETYAPAP